MLPYHTNLGNSGYRRELLVGLHILMVCVHVEPKILALALVDL